MRMNQMPYIFKCAYKSSFFKNRRGKNMALYVPAPIPVLCTYH